MLARYWIGSSDSKFESLIRNVQVQNLMLQSQDRVLEGWTHYAGYNERVAVNGYIEKFYITFYFCSCQDQLRMHLFSGCYLYLHANLNLRASIISYFNVCIFTSVYKT